MILQPGDDGYQAIHTFWVENGKPFQFERGRDVWIAVTDGDTGEVVFRCTQQTGLDQRYDSRSTP